MAKRKRWHPSQESDELVFAVCDRFLNEMSKRYDRRSDGSRGAKKKVSVASVADWLRSRWGRNDLTREKIYPLFWEAARRGYMFLDPPRDLHFAQQIAQLCGIERLGTERESIQVLNHHGPGALGHVAQVGGDLLLALIKRVGQTKRERGDADPRVHIGLGGGFSAMTVAKRLANRIKSDLHCPPLVLHAISAGGFLVNEPQKAPVTYFSYFDDMIPPCEFVGLFSATVVPSGEYEQVIRNPGLREPFQRAGEVDIVVTSFAACDDDHGLLNQYLKHLIDHRELRPEVFREMLAAGWVGDVQFRPYTEDGPMVASCPVKAVTLFEIPDLVQLVRKPDKYVVLLAGPCGQCGKTKTRALLPLLTRPNLRLWTHLITDVQTAGELICATQ